MVRAAIAYAEADADLVGMFLREYCGLPCSPEGPLELPADHLMDLAAALRLWVWESAGLDPREVAGLPDFRSAIREVALQRRSAPGDPAPTRRPGELSRDVLNACFDRFAWRGRIDFGADLVLDDADEDVLVEALARLVWANRHAGREPPPATEADHGHATAG
jgi:hypothetical protein